MAVAAKGTQPQSLDHAVVVYIWLPQPLLVVGATGTKLRQLQRLTIIKWIATFLVCMSMINPLVASPTTNGKGCFQCLDLMNRGWRSDPNKVCSGTKQDCGKCVDGYYANRTDEKCQPNKKFITVTEHDKAAYVSYAETVVIQCYFNETIDCAWVRRGYSLEIGGRYSYVTRGTDTKDCSIMITPFKEIDVGLWQCYSMADSTQWAIQSTHVRVMQAIIPSIIVAPQDIVASEGDEVVLICKFDADVQCFWQRDGVQVSINDRYQFIGTSVAHDQTRRDCSIKIANVNIDDFGQWTCNYNRSSYNDDYAKSARISAKNNPDGQPKDVKGDEGFSRELSKPVFKTNLGNGVSKKMIFAEFYVVVLLSLLHYAAFIEE